MVKTPKTGLHPKQSGVLRGVLAALACVLTTISFSIKTPPLFLIPTTPLAAIQAALRCFLVPAACLAFYAGAVGNHRFLNVEDIDGAGLTKGSPQIKILQAMLQNTLEQSVLAMAVWSVWASCMPLHWQAVIPAAACMFAVGRVLFRCGYAKGAPFRAAGFGMTAYPSLIMMLIAAARMTLVSVAARE